MTPRVDTFPTTTITGVSREWYKDDVDLTRAGVSRTSTESPSPLGGPSPCRPREDSLFTLLNHSSFGLSPFTSQPSEPHRGDPTRHPIPTETPLDRSSNMYTGL